VFPLWKGVEVGPSLDSELACGPLREQFSDRLQRSDPAPTSSLVSARNHEEDRQFESPPLQQRVSANRRSHHGSTLPKRLRGGDRRVVCHRGWAPTVDRLRAVAHGAISVAVLIRVEEIT